MTAPIYPLCAFIWIAATEAVAVGTPADMWQVMLQYGGLGVMLLWFMFRVERRMESYVDAAGREGWWLMQQGTIT